MNIFKNQILCNLDLARYAFAMDNQRGWYEKIGRSVVYHASNGLTYLCRFTNANNFRVCRPVTFPVDGYIYWSNSGNCGFDLFKANQDVVLI